MGYSKEERNALQKKMENPSTCVICPRCGKTLKFTQLGSAAVVECETKGCIKEVERGI